MDREYPYQDYEQEVTDEGIVRKYFTYLGPGKKILDKIQVNIVVRNLAMKSTEGHSIVAKEGGYLKFERPDGVTVEMIVDISDDDSDLRH